VVHELDVGAVIAARERHPQRVKDEIGAHVRRTNQQMELYAAIDGLKALVTRRAPVAAAAASRLRSQ
jgi:ribonuclease HI